MRGRQAKPEEIFFKQKQTRVAFVRKHSNLVFLWHKGRNFRAVTGNCKLAASTNFIRGISAGKVNSFRLNFVSVSDKRGSVINDYETSPAAKSEEKRMFSQAMIISSQNYNVVTFLFSEQQEKPSLREWLSPELAKPLILSIGLMFFQQFTGMNAVIFNAASIFSAAGFKNGKLVGITIGLMQFLGTCLACLIIERTGRRILLLISSITLAVSQLGLGLYFEIYIPPHDESQSSDALSSIIHSVEASKISWLSVFCLIFFNLGHALAWGPIPWLVMSEIFPLRARGPAGSISVLSNWLAAFIVTLTFNSLQSSFTVPGAYWFYAGWLLLGFVFVYLLMPETKGKTLEEIEALFDKNKRSYQPIE